MHPPPRGGRPIGLQKPKRDNKWRYRTRRAEQDIETDHTARGANRREAFQHLRLAAEAVLKLEGPQTASDALRSLGSDLAEEAVNRFSNACKSVVRPGEKRRAEIRAVLLRYVAFAEKRGWRHGHRRTFVRAEVRDPTSPMWDKFEESQERNLRTWLIQANRGDFGVIPGLCVAVDDGEAA